MSNNLLKIELPPIVSNETIAQIEQSFPKEEGKIYRNVFTCDDANVGSTLLSIYVEIINSPAACEAIASILISWLKIRNSKNIKIKNGDQVVEYSNLNAKELATIIEKNKGIDLSLNKDD